MQMSSHHRATCTLLIILSLNAHAPAIDAPGGTAATSARTTTAPATRAASADRSTPQAAMRAMAQALSRHDEVALADGIRLTGDADGKLARAIARQMIAGQTYWEAAQRRWGRGEAIEAYVKRGIVLPDAHLEWPLAPFRVQGDHAFTERAAAGKRTPALSPLRRVGGQWCWDPMLRGSREKEREFLLARAEADVAKYGKLAADIEAGKFASVHDAIDVIHPREPRNEPPEPRFSREQLDPKTIPGAMLSIGYAAQAEDPAAMAKFYHADGPGGAQLVDAYVRSMLAVNRFIVAMAQLDRDESPSKLAMEFGLIDRRSDTFGHLLTEWTIVGDRATGTNEAGPAEATLRRVDGTWRIDLTPPAGSPLPPEKLAEELRRQTKIVTAVSADVAGKRLFTVDEVRRELKRRGLAPATRPADAGEGAGEGAGEAGDAGDGGVDVN